MKFDDYDLIAIFYIVIFVASILGVYELIQYVYRHLNTVITWS